MLYKSNLKQKPKWRYLFRDTMSTLMNACLRKVPTCTVFTLMLKSVSLPQHLRTCFVHCWRCSQKMHLEGVLEEWQERKRSVSKSSLRVKLFPSLNMFSSKGTRCLLMMVHGWSRDVSLMMNIKNVLHILPPSHSILIELKVWYLKEVLHNVFNVHLNQLIKFHA